MRDTIEAFVGNGGNVAFFSGNVCWWQVRFEDNNRTMICYKDKEKDKTANPGVDNQRLTDNWIKVGRRENRMTGVSYERGAGWWKSDAGDRPFVGYNVRLSQHWVFDKTNLKNNDNFGIGSSIVGYETDAALFIENDGVPQVTGTDDTPPNFQVLATADLSNWVKGGHSGPDNDGTGKATLGIYRNKGIVFTAATTDWFRGLAGEWNVIQQITYNVISRLSCPSTLSPNIANSGFEKWNGSKPDHWLLEGDGSPEGRIEREENSVINGKYSLKIDATAGQTWISQGNFNCDGRNNYRVGCWAKTNHPGATIRLQSTGTWHDFAIAEHSGSGKWEYLSAVGAINDEGPIFPARVKIQIATGVIAFFDNVVVEVL
jgi:hypothetical protein